MVLLFNYDTLGGKIINIRKYILNLFNKSDNIIKLFKFLPEHFILIAL